MYPYYSNKDMKPYTPEEQVLADMAISAIGLFGAIGCFVGIAVIVRHILSVGDTICQELALRTNQVANMAQYVDECHEQMFMLGMLMLGLGVMLFATVIGVLGARSNFFELTKKYSDLEESERKNNDDRLVA